MQQAHPSSVQALEEILALPGGILQSCADDINRHVTRESRKKGSGSRLFHKPDESLMSAQKAILDGLLKPIGLPDELHGSVIGRNQKSNVTPHIGAPICLKMDIKDFYPSLDWRRVYTMWRDLGYSHQVARLLARLTTCDGYLALGFPTSPAVANIIVTHTLLPRLWPLCSKHGFTLTVYLDDLTISGGKRLVDFQGLFLRILEESGFPPNLEKNRLLARSQQRLCTGLVFNEFPNIPKRYYRSLRNELHRCRRDGVSAHATGSIFNYRLHLLSRIGYVRYHNPLRGEKLQLMFQQLAWDL